MNEIKESKIKLLHTLIDEVNNIKKNNSNLELDLNLPSSKCNYEMENAKIFYTNLYILLKVYNKEIMVMKDKQGNFSIEEYYMFIESINLPDSIYELYIRMPEMLSKNKKLSYATDIPSFMGM